MQITFSGGLKVQARFGGFVVETDQPAPAGEGSAPAPFELFLASLGTCAGLYALRFCERREIPTEALGVRLETETDGHRLTAVRIHLDLPPGFPEKYEEAVVRAASLCAVKRAIEEPPQFDVIAHRRAA